MINLDMSDPKTSSLPPGTITRLQKDTADDNWAASKVDKFWIELESENYDRNNASLSKNSATDGVILRLDTSNKKSEALA